MKSSMLRSLAVEKVLQNTESQGDCLVYTGSGVGKGGYGRVTVSRGGVRKSFGAHRIMYEECNGVIPDGMLVRHSCHNPACINPSHLSLGTNRDNAQDRIKSGRCASQKGADNGNSKLTHEQRLEVLRRRECGETLKSIAADFGVHFSTISVIAKRGV